ncbi:MAG: DNA internalization-related competence protein ComEC/Rec2, partial [Firmicutes bacterium]|nr:DNA internalization-related competence protein ComEC/Rec2 [Bacillota bacterium]
MKRPLPYMLFFLCLGIYFSDCIDNISKLLAAAVIILAAAFVCVLNTKRIFTALFALMAFMGLFVFKAETNHYDRDRILNETAVQKGSVSISGIITDVSKSSERNVYKVKTESIAAENGALINEPCGVRVFTKEKFLTGDIIKVKARLYAHSGKLNPSDFDNRLYLRIHGCDYSIYCNDDVKPEITGHDTTLIYALRNTMYSVRGKIGEVYDKNFAPDRAAVLKAVTTGDKSFLDNDIKDSFKGAGIYHFLSISGLHISVIAAFMVYIIGRLSKKAAYITAMLFLALYWFLTGGSVSVTRAVLMIYIYLLGRLFGRKADIINSASAAALILLLYKPLYLFDTGFLYSFLAVFGIGLAFIPLKNYDKKGRKIVLSAAASFGATLFTRLVTLVSYYTLNLYEILINIILIPFMSVIVVYAMGIGTLGLTGLDMGAAAAPLSGMLDILIYAAEKLSSFTVIKTGCPTYEMFFLLLAATLAVMLFLLRPRKLRLAAVFAFISLIILTAALQKDNITRVNFLYVGQANCCVITKGKTACIIDCGGNELSDIGSDNGTYKVLPFLNYSGVDTIEAVFISHTDTDHIKGLFDLMGNIEIKNIYTSRYVGQNDNYSRLLTFAKQNGIPVTRLSVGDTVINGTGSFKCLYPVRFDEKENNKNSMVLKADLMPLTVLFTGDTDKECENEIVESGADISADILELPHHGSSTSGRVSFIKAVSPKAAVASSGINNRYGHPTKEIVDKMRKYNIPLYKTYDGFVCFMVKDGNFTVYR